MNAVLTEKKETLNRKTLEQKRAKSAWDEIQKIKGELFESEYASWAKKLPVLVLTNGLGQALAFLKSKSNGNSNTATAQRKLLEALNRWLLNPSTFKWEDNSSDVLQRIVESSSDTYRLATMEALAFLNWLRRFAEGYLEKNESQEQQL